jgi:hypothetical protein
MGPDPSSNRVSRRYSSGGRGGAGCQIWGFWEGGREGRTGTLGGWMDGIGMGLAVPSSLARWLDWLGWIRYDIARGRQQGGAGQRMPGS